MRIDNVCEQFSRMAAAAPLAPALAVMGEDVSYGQLAERADRLAAHLLASGAGKGDLVAVLADDTVLLIVAMLAVWKAGGIVVPLDPATPEIRLRSLLAEVAPAWMLVEPALAGAAAAAAPGRPQLLLPGPDPGAPAAPLPAALGGDDPCYVYFTSGSTGRPKGITGRFKAIGHFVGWEIELLGVGPGTRVSQLTSPAFDAFLRDVFTPLCAGGTVCIPPSRETVLDARQLAGWLAGAAVQVVHCVPSLLRALLGQELAAESFPQLAAVLVAGEPLLPADAGRFRRVFGDRVQLINLYGPSEATMTKLFYRVQAGDEDRRSIPIGMPMDGARAVLVDARGKPCPPGAVGEIYLRTPFLTLGYHGRPELTREVFVPNPWSGDPDDVVYRTGDFARLLPDGNFEFLGRRDHQVKVRGVRVELPEVQSALLEHPAITDVAVVDRQDRDGETVLCAYFVAAAPVGAGELRDLCTARLPEAMVPSAFMRLEALPRTLSGKIDRAALPAPGGGRPELAPPPVPPHNPLERELRQIWQEVLDVRPIGVRDDFFELGGHSLLAVRLLARVQKLLGVTLPLATLFRARTIERLAVLIREEDQGRNKLRPLVEIQAGEPGGLPLFLVHPVGGTVLAYQDLAVHMGAEQRLYALQDPYLEIEGGEAIELSFEEMAAEYLAAVREVQPAGPYLLGGWSFGGLVAFEMAQQLRRAGEEVDLLAVIDARPRITDTEEADSDVLAGIARDLARRVDRQLDLAPEDLAAIPPADRLDHVLEKMQEADLIAPELRRELVHRYLARRRSRVRAACAYVAQPYPGQVTIFRARDPDPLAPPPDAAADDRTLGWSELSRVPPAVVEVPGYHAALMFAPYVKTVAEELKACIYATKEA